MTNCGNKNVNNTNCSFSESNDTVEYNRGDTYYSPRGPITTHTAPNGNQNFNSGSGMFNTAGSQTFAAPNGQPEKAEGSPIPDWDPNGQVQAQPLPWSQHEATAQQGPFERRGNIRLENCGWKNVGNTNSTFVESNDRTAYTSGDYCNDPQGPINTYTTPGGTQNFNNGGGIFNNIGGSQTFGPIDGQRVGGYPNPWQTQHRAQATPVPPPFAQGQRENDHQAPPPANGCCPQHSEPQETCTECDSGVPAAPSRYNPFNPYNSQMYGPSARPVGPSTVTHS
ncbi:hypothetical protein EYR38_001658 [Pleurotus pulmonarius]|nr:hypothetical protein EYR38_001658 [Pleurotus pulmonarius]